MQTIQVNDAITQRARVFALIEVTMAAMVWGASFIAMKVALRDVSPSTIMWLRFGMGVFVLGAIVFSRKQFYFPAGKDLGFFALLGFLGLTLHLWLQTTALKTAQASTSAWIVTTTPVYIALLGWILLKEKLGWLRIGGIALASAGVLLILSKGQLSALVSGHFGTQGDYLILASAPIWAIYTVLSRRSLSSHPAALKMLYVMFFGWLSTSVLFFSGPGLSEIGQLTFSGWLGIVFLGIICSGFANAAWYDALQVVPASQVGVFLYLEPLVAMVVAGVVLGEPILIASVIGGSMILTGVWLVQNNGKKQAVNGNE